MIGRTIMARIPVEKPSPTLIQQIHEKNVVPIIGAGMSKAARIIGAYDPFPSYQELLKQLLDRAQLSPDIRRVAQSQLDAAKTDPKALEELARTLKERMGRFPFYGAIRSILEPLDIQIEESLAHKLLRMLNFQRILTTNYDRLLERFLPNDYEAFTARDFDTFNIFTVEKKRRFILKMHGDITRPDTIPFGITDLYRHYGFDENGRNLAEISRDAEQLRSFLKGVFKENTVLFLGSSLSESEGFAKLLSVLVDELGGNTYYRHYALVPFNKEAESLRQSIAARLNVEYVQYHVNDDDNSHSQVAEFLAFLLSATQDKPIIAGKSWERSYLADERDSYLNIQLEREKNADAVYFFTPSMTNAITTEEHINTSSRKGLQERFSDTTFVDKVIKVMLERRGNVAERITGGEMEVKVLFLETELRRDFVTTGKDLKNVVKRYKYLLKLIKKPNFEVRLIPNLTANQLKDNHQASYALIFNTTNIATLPETDVTLAYASQATVNYFEIHLVQINTFEARDRVYQFERFWTSALSESSVVQIINELIIKAQVK